MIVNRSQLVFFPAILIAVLAFASTLLSYSALAQENFTDDTWKVSLKNADIREFVAQVSIITGKSFVIDPRVKGNVTVISNTPMDKSTVYELFLSVLRVHGYAAVPSGNITKIVQQVLAKQSGNPKDFQNPSSSEELVTAVIQVRNSPSEELVKILRPLIPQYGHVAGISSPNVLIVSDHAENIARLTEIVKRIDVANNQSMEIIGLKDAWVEDLISLLEELAPEQIGTSAKGPNRITIVASERTNSLVVKGEKVNVEKIKKLILQLDVPANRSGSTKVVRLAHSDATEIAEILRNTIVDDEDNKSNKVKISIQPDEALNALVIRADPSAMLEILDVIKSLDVRRMQVLIEAAIVEVTADFSRQLGSELLVGDAGSRNVPLGLTAPSGTLAQVLENIALGGAGGPPDLGTSPLIAGGRINETGTSFAVIIRALSTNGDVNLLSTPSITTMDNEEAKIVVGQNVPFRTGSTTSGSDGASNPFTTIQREDVGLTLEVTPHIHDGNLVRLKVHQEVSEVDPASLTVIGAQGSADLITNVRTIDTTILADNQEVIIIGGLIRDKKTANKSKVPLLGSIPGLGFLFSSSSTTTQKQNLLVFLRPTVLDSRNAITSETKRKFSSIYEIEIEGKDPTNAISDLFNGNAP